MTAKQFVKSIYPNAFSERLTNMAGQRQYWEIWENSKMPTNMRSLGWTTARSAHEAWDNARQRILSEMVKGLEA